MVAWMTKSKHDGRAGKAAAGHHHWQMMRVAPEFLHCLTMSRKYCFSVLRRASNFSTVSMSTCRSKRNQIRLCGQSCEHHLH